MQYSFENIDIDTYKLVYTNKNNEKVEKTFKRTIEMAEKLDSVVAVARINMFATLSKMGMTKDNLIVKKKDGKGHVIYDESNYIEFEKKYIEEQTGITVDEIIKECFGMGLVDLMVDMGVDPEDNNSDVQEKALLFGQKFGLIISRGEEDKIPSGEDKKPENK